MAKGNMLLGYARGKVGSLVFSRANGEQITRAKAAKVHNPRSAGQQIQRMIFGTVAFAYQVLRPICDHSFENVTYGARSMNKFFSLNLKQLRAYYPTDQDPDKRPMDGKAFMLPSREGAVGTGLQISAGSLPEIQAHGYDEVEQGETAVLHGFGNSFVAAGAEPTVAEVMQALGAVVGDQITVVAVDDTNKLLLSRYVINADADAAALAAKWDEKGKAAAYDATKTNVNDMLVLTCVKELDSQYWWVQIDGANEYQAVSIILSRKSSTGKWLRSNAWLWNTQDEAPMYSAAYALPYWQFAGTEIDAVSEKYLNNAEL